MRHLQDSDGPARVEADMHELCGVIGNRLAAGPGEAAAARFLERRFHELQLRQVATRPFACRRWLPGVGRLEVLDPPGPARACLPCTHAAATPATGVEGELLILEAPDYVNGLRVDAETMRDRIGLFFGSYGESAALFAALHDSPLAALLFVDTRMQCPWPVANGMGEKFMGLVRKPMAFVSLMDAWELARSGTQRVRLFAAGRVEDGVSANVTAELPGTAADGRVIVVGAHLDSVAVGVGADDNAAGIAAVLECARRLRVAAPRHTLRFIGFGAEEQLSVGAWRYVREQAEDLDRIGLICNIDGAGAWLGHSEVLVTGTPELEALVQDRVADRAGFGTVRAGVSPYQDAYPFAAAGIPGLWFGRPTGGDIAWFHHSTYNDGDACSTTQIAWTAEVVSQFVAELVQARDWPFDRRLAPGVQETVAAYRRELFDA